MKTKLKQTSNESQVSQEDSARLRSLHRACVINAHQLFHEGELLAEHGHYARAAFLAVAAYEEMGKAQIVADYAQNCSSFREFEKAFRDHRLKNAYMMRQAAADKEVTIVYDRENAGYQIDLREQALYVQYRDTYDDLILPSQITKDECEFVFKKTYEAFEEIENAERLNGRVGSKSLFK